MNETHKGLTPDEIIEYLRKSRSDDALLSVEEVLAKHEQILDDWAENNLGGKVPEENKYREVVSGETIEDRPQIKEILRLIESPRVKGILVVEVQRLSRGDLEDAGRLIKLLRYTNTLVITPQKTYDLRDDYDRDFFERELKRGNEFLEYQKKILNRGRLLSVQQGNYIGSHPPYGYERTTVMDGKRKCPTLKIKEDEANIVRMIFEMYVNEKLGRTTIANRLDDMGIKPPLGKYWSPHSIKDILTNVHYIGKVKWNFRKTIHIVADGEVIRSRPKTAIEEFLVYDGKHEPIISEELFNASVERHGKNPKARADKQLRNPFAGLLFCHCGAGISLRFYKRKDGTEQCAPRMLCNKQHKCQTGSCTFEEMTDKVCEILEKCIEDFEVRVNGDNKTAQKLHANMVKDLEKKLVSLDAKEVSLWDKYTEDGMPKHIFDQLNEKLLHEREEINNALCKAKESMPDPIDYEERLQRFKDALAMLRDADAPIKEKNDLLKQCIERMVYKREKPKRLTREPGEKKGTRFKKPGGYFTSPPIELDVKLRV